MANKKKLESHKNDVLDITPAQHFDRNSYIKGLEEAVKKAMAQMESWIDDNGIDDSMVESFKSRLDQGYLDYKEQIEDEAPDSEDEIIEWWHEYEKFFDEEDSKQPEFCQSFMDIYKIAFLNALADYSKEKHLGDNVLKTIEGFRDEVYEGNPILNLTNNVLSSINFFIPYLKISSASSAAIKYAVYNRPVVGHLLKDEDRSTLSRFLNWDLVYKELQKFPVLRLEAMIQKTDCPSDVKVTLYNSITSNDVTLFTNTIKSYEREAYEMVELAYVMDFVDKMMELGAQRLNPEREMLNPLEEIADFQDFFAFQNPFEEFDFSFFSSEALGNKEQFLSALDKGFRMLEELKRIAYPLEKKIYNKVLGLINQYPELKKAYEDYKAKQDAASIMVEVAAPLVSEESKGKSGENDNNGVYHLPVSIQNVDIDKLVRLLTEKDELNKNHVYITVLESKGDADVATCLKHFLGNASTTPLSFRLKWNGNSKVSLKFLIRLLVNTNNEATVDDVIDKKSKSDGISKKVSKWTGSGDLWTPVYNAFDGCTSSIFSIKLGDEGSKARNLNIEQLETIAKIYFACKK